MKHVNDVLPPACRYVNLEKVHVLYPVTSRKVHVHLTSNHVMMCVGDVKVGDVKVVAVRWETSRW